MHDLYIPYDKFPCQYFLTTFFVISTLDAFSLNLSISFQFVFSRLLYPEKTHGMCFFTCLYAFTHNFLPATCLSASSLCFLACSTLKKHTACVFSLAYMLLHTIFSPPPAYQLPVCVFSLALPWKNTRHVFFHLLICFYTQFSLRHLPISFRVVFSRLLSTEKTHGMCFFTCLYTFTHSLLFATCLLASGLCFLACKHPRIPIS